jgi:DNA-binding transcriptional ArsR family regulator
MSQAPAGTRTGTVGRTTTETTTVSEESKQRSLLGAFDDADSRAILEATSRGAHTASELADRCDIPLSTAYRKLDRLSDVGLLEEQMRIQRSGKHTSEYRRAIEGVTVDICDDGELDVIVTHGGEEACPTAMTERTSP